MRLISFGISGLMFALVGCAASASTASDTSADTTHDAPPIAVVMSIPDAVAALESSEILPAGGLDDAYAYPCDGATALDAIKAYIDGKYDSDPEDGDGFTFVANATGFDIDDQVAGTMTTNVAIVEVESAIANNDTTHDANVLANRGDEIKGILQSIAAAGGSFGFDGFGQNGCAAPTAMLLVVDPAVKTVYGVDLNPCSEE